MNCNNGHNWQTPQPGETALLCLDCGRTLNRHTEITPNMAASINSRQTRLNERESHTAHLFKAFFGYGPLLPLWRDEERRQKGERVEYQCCPGEVEKLYREDDSARHEQEGLVDVRTARRMVLFTAEEMFNKFQGIMEPEEIELFQRSSRAEERAKWVEWRQRQKEWQERKEAAVRDGRAFTEAEPAPPAE